MILISVKSYELLILSISDNPRKNLTLMNWVDYSLAVFRNISKGNTEVALINNWDDKRRVKIGPAVPKTLM